MKIKIENEFLDLVKMIDSLQLCDIRLYAYATYDFEGEFSSFALVFINSIDGVNGLKMHWFSGLERELISLIKNPFHPELSKFELEQIDGWYKNKYGKTQVQLFDDYEDGNIPFPKGPSKEERDVFKEKAFERYCYNIAGKICSRLYKTVKEDSEISSYYNAGELTERNSFDITLNGVQVISCKDLCEEDLKKH